MARFGVYTHRTRFISDKNISSFCRDESSHIISPSLFFSFYLAANTCFGFVVESHRSASASHLSFSLICTISVEGSSQYLGFAAFAAMATISFALYVSTIVRAIYKRFHSPAATAAVPQTLSACARSIWFCEAHCMKPKINGVVKQCKYNWKCIRCERFSQ